MCERNGNKTKQRSEYLSWNTKTRSLVTQLSRKINSLVKLYCVKCLKLLKDNCPALIHKTKSFSLCSYPWGQLFSYNWSIDSSFCSCQESDLRLKKPVQLPLQALWLKTWSAFLKQWTSKLLRTHETSTLKSMI